jgi:hypothetical protein
MTRHYRVTCQRTLQHTDTAEIIVHASSEDDAYATAERLLAEEAETGSDIYNWVIGSDDLYDVDDVSVDSVCLAEGDWEPCQSDQALE